MKGKADMEESQVQPEFGPDLLEKLVSRWGRRVAVKQDELDLDHLFDPGLPDFPAALVPALDVPGARGIDPQARQQVLAAAWIAYNAKTIAVEQEVILPACRLMLTGRLPGRKDGAAFSALQQTIIDEHYHILMAHNAAGVTRRRRDLPDLTFDPRGWSVVRGLAGFLDGLPADRADLAWVAYALAAETTINLLFDKLATDLSIQPMNRITVDMHRRDESGHTAIFRVLAGALYRDLGNAERALLREALVQGLADFRAFDASQWVAVAACGGVRTSAEEVTAAAAARPAAPRDTGPLQALLADLGLAGELGSVVHAAAGR
jgi:alpha-N-dichloroacetyl-p-aminophenylserinol N-oxygenase